MTTGEHESEDQADGNSNMARPDTGAAGGGATAADTGQGGAQHGLRGGAGSPGVGGCATPAIGHAARFIETSKGILSYLDLAPLLADRVADVEEGIARNRYAALPLDEYLILALHRDIAAELVPTVGGRWRLSNVQIGAHEPPPYQRVPELMRAYALDLKARLEDIEGQDDDRLLETLAFAEGRLLSIHPFADFNGRATRVFLSELLRRQNLPAVDPTPDAGPATQQYLAALAAADSNDWEPLKMVWLARFEADRFFETNFKALTGHIPMRWQARLFQDHFLAGNLPGSVSISTGLGKTAVMAVWLIALAWQMRYAPVLTLPRRMVYVVDRRVVVDQATEFAETLRANVEQPQAAELRATLCLEGRELPISTLRGKFVDNRQWLEDPACPAIIVGTVDMVGSRLLFGGYGISPKMRPYHAGLLGADALIVLDEAHLVPPFESLLASIEGESHRYGATSATDRALVPPFKLLSLSATGRERAGEVFALAGSAELPAGLRGDLDDPIVAMRLSAKKAVSFVEAQASELPEALAEQAWTLTDNGLLPARCVVFCNSREVADKTRELVQKWLGVEHKANTELLVGARRVREREDAKTRLEGLGFLAGKPAAREKPVFLFATSAGEVG